MALPHAISEQTKGKGTTASALAKLLNKIASWINRFRVLAPLTLKNTGLSVELSLDADDGNVLVAVKITAAKGTTETGYYDGDIYGNGTAAAATIEDQLILVTGFDIDSTTTQGFYWAQKRIVDIGGDTNVYQIIPGYPIPPASGNYDLVAKDGVVSWSQWVDCDGNPV